MTCVSPERERSYLESLRCRVTWLECAVKVWGKILHTAPTHTVKYAAVVSVTEDVDGVFSVTWVSEPGSFYEVQESADGIMWYLAAKDVPAAPLPEVLTTWLSAPIPVAEDVFYRVVVLPRRLVDCSLSCLVDPDAPLPAPVRYTDQLVGPTGGSPLGGCSDCAGEFPADCYGILVPTTEP